MNNNGWNWQDLQTFKPILATVWEYSCADHLLLCRSLRESHVGRIDSNLQR